MKHKILFVFLGIALSIPSYAQNKLVLQSEGNNNTSTVSQVGDILLSDITQTGNGNDAGIEQVDSNRSPPYKVNRNFSHRMWV